MGRDVLSVRQIMVVLVTALLAPLTDLLPGLTAWAMRGGGWLAVWGALPLLLFSLWTTKDGGPLNGTTRRVINVMYLLWIPVPLGMFLHLSGDRLAIIYGRRAGLACVTALLLLALWMAAGKVSAFARAAEIFYLALAVVLAGLMLLAIFKVDWRNLAAPQEGLAGIPVGSTMVAGVILNLYPIVVLKNKVAIEERDRRKAIGWVVAFCGAMALVVVVVVGCLGAALTMKVSSPFLIMVQGLGIKGAFQRTEALIATLWTVSDLVVAGALLHAWRGIAEQVHRGNWCKWGVIPVAAVAWGVMWVLGPEEMDIQYNIYSTVLTVGGLFFGLFLPTIMCVISGFTKKDC